MGSNLHAIRPLLDRRTLHALWRFDCDFQNAGLNMYKACRTFFARSGFAVEINRRWKAPVGPILFVSDHTSPLDGFAMSLACPPKIKLKRTIFLLTALCMGQTTFRHNVVVWPKGSYSGLIHRTHGILPRLMYILTHRWGWWVRPNRALRKICDTLMQGTSLSILPSGEIAQSRWRSGVGAVVIELARQRGSLKHPCFLAPVYIRWDVARRCVRIEAPGLVSMDSLFDKALHADGREEFTLWLSEIYHDRAWTFSEAESLSQASPRIMATR